jgi:ribosomal protein L29
MSTDNLINKYLNENDQKIAQAKKELAYLRKSEKMGKLTDQGKRKIERIENYLFSKGIFDFL